MKVVNICIVDDHKIVREGLQQLLEKLGNYNVCADFESGEDFLDNLPIDPTPDIYIIDYSMSRMNGIEILKYLNELQGEYKVLILTQYLNEEVINEAYMNGARGFLNKNCAAHDLKYAIDNIVNIGFNNVSEILKRIRSNDNKNNQDSNKIVLSERETDFLTRVCCEKELTYEQIAVLMKVSLKSVDGYRASLFEKYGIRSKIGLVLFSHKNKLTEPFLD